MWVASSCYWHRPWWRKLAKGHQAASSSLILPASPCHSGDLVTPLDHERGCVTAGQSLRNSLCHRRLDTALWPLPSPASSFQPRTEREDLPEQVGQRLGGPVQAAEGLGAAGRGGAPAREGTALRRPAPPTALTMAAGPGSPPRRQEASSQRSGLEARRAAASSRGRSLCLQTYLQQAPRQRTGFLGDGKAPGGGAVSSWRHPGGCAAARGSGPQVLRGAAASLPGDGVLGEHRADAPVLPCRLAFLLLLPSGLLLSGPPSRGPRPARSEPALSLSRTQSSQGLKP